MSPTATTDSALETAIERLYAAFRTSHPPFTVHSSPHACIGDEQATRLLARPLRELSTADLDRYARSALTTWGNVDDFKYFLPRIFELFVRHPGWSDALILETLARAEWHCWPEPERVAMRNYLDALWRYALDKGPDAIDASAVLRGIGLAGEDVRPLLDVWRAARSREATRQIANLVLLEERTLYEGVLASYWHPKDRDAILAFLREPDTLRRVEEAYVDADPGAGVRDLATAADVLATLHAR